VAAIEIRDLDTNFNNRSLLNYSVFARKVQLGWSTVSWVIALKTCLFAFRPFCTECHMWRLRPCDYATRHRSLYKMSSEDKIREYRL